MNGWESILQMLVMFFAGAWVYARGCKHVSPLPDEEIARGVGNLLDRRQQHRNENNRPTLPRVGA